MPFALLLIGLVIVVAAYRGQLDELQQLLKEDFADGRFLAWMAALFAIGAVGIVKPFRPAANAFLFLAVLGLLLSNRGFFNELKQQVVGNG